MIKRKLYNYLLNWKKTKKKEALLIKGARQVGKTFLVREFGKNEYESFIEINFLKNGLYKSIFLNDNLSADERQHLLMSAIPMLPDFQTKAGNEGQIFYVSKDVIVKRYFSKIEKAAR